MLRLIVLFGVLAACGPKPLANSSNLDGLDTVHSNINVDGFAERTVESLRLIPNTNVPKGFLVSLTPWNKNFVTTLYGIVHGINKTDGLAGLDGPKQEITMAVVNSDETARDALEVAMRSNAGIGATAPLPYYAKIDAPNDFDLWMQDWGEFAAVKVQGLDHPVHAVMESGRGLWSSLGAVDTKIFSETFNIPFLNVSNEALGTVGSGNYGGNTEAMPDGRLYHGDRLTDQSMRDRLDELGNTDRVEIASNWLFVGHVDEFVTYIPAKNACGNRLIAASPLDAFEMLYDATDAQVAAAGLPIANIATLKDALKYYLKPGQTLQSGAFDLDQFDASKAPRLNHAADSYVQDNLRFEAVIMSGVAKLRANAACDGGLTLLPQLFTDEGSGALATLGGSTNMLVLREHLIIPEPKLDQLHPTLALFRNAITTRLAPLVGGVSKVHFIDTSVYHTNAGEIHCGTNVVRELAMPVQIP